MSVFKMSQKGLSAIEIIVAAAISTIVIGGISVPIMQEFRTRKKIESYYWVSQVRTEVITTLRKKAAFENTVMMADNSSMACLQPKVNGGSGISLDCRDQGGAINKVLNENGQIILDSSLANTGFDQNGRVCNDFALDSVTCPFRYELQWSAICKSVGTCFNPDVRIEGRLLVSQAIEAQFDPKIYAFRWVMPTTEKAQVVCNTSGIGSASGTDCNLNIQTACPSGQYLVGFQKSGTPICRELVSQSCGANQVLEGFDSSGQKVCGAVCR